MTIPFRTITRDDLVEYVRQYYKGPRMVLCGAGGVDHEHLVHLAQKYFGNIERGSDKVLEFEAGKFTQSRVGNSSCFMQWALSRRLLNLLI